MDSRFCCFAMEIDMPKSIEWSIATVCFWLFMISLCAHGLWADEELAFMFASGASAGYGLKMILD